MKVLNLCQDDWANFAHDNAVTLQRIGIDAKCMKRAPHVMNYPMQGQIASIESIKKAIKEADVIQFFHDNVHFFQALIPAFAGKKVIAYHTGTYYRKNHAQVNAIMTPHIYRAVGVMPEFTSMGGKHIMYMAGAIDTNKIKPNYYTGRTPRVVGHFPSNAIVKGTETIKQIMAGIKEPHEFRCNDVFCGHDTYLEQMADCDIYLELFSMQDSAGSRYGNFGVTALEAAAMGKVVVTNCLDKDIYELYYGPIGLNIQNTVTGYAEAIREYLEMDGAQLAYEQMLMCEWLVTNHSYEASGKYTLEKVLLP